MTNLVFAVLFSALIANAAAAQSSEAGNLSKIFTEQENARRLKEQYAKEAAEKARLAASLEREAALAKYAADWALLPKQVLETQLKRKAKLGNHVDIVESELEVRTYPLEAATSGDIRCTIPNGSHFGLAGYVKGRDGTVYKVEFRQVQVIAGHSPRRNPYGSGLRMSGDQLVWSETAFAADNLGRALDEVIPKSVQELYSEVLAGYVQDLIGRHEVVEQPWAFVGPNYDHKYQVCDTKYVLTMEP